jgi:hypothetical protein
MLRSGWPISIVVNEPIGGHLNFALNLNHTPFLKLIFLLETFVDRRRDLNLAGLSVGFHTRSDIHCISPNIVGKFPRTDDGSDDGPSRVDADAQAEGFPVGPMASCISKAIAAIASA